MAKVSVTIFLILNTSWRRGSEAAELKVPGALENVTSISIVFLFELTNEATRSGGRSGRLDRVWLLIIRLARPTMADVDASGPSAKIDWRRLSGSVGVWELDDKTVWNNWNIAACWFQV